MQEIERQFVCEPPEASVLDGAPVEEILQGYLTRGEPAVRVRRLCGEAEGDPITPPARWILGVKSGRGRVREEVEAEVDEEDGRSLLEMAGGTLVEKRRHRLGRWVVDVFGGSLQGLVAMEVELESPDEPLPDPPEGMRMLREVTEEPRFTNQALAHLSEVEARALVEEVSGWTR